MGGAKSSIEILTRRFWRNPSYEKKQWHSVYKYLGGALRLEDLDQSSSGHTQIKAHDPAVQAPRIPVEIFADGRQLIRTHPSCLPRPDC